MDLKKIGISVMAIGALLLSVDYLRNSGIMTHTTSFAVPTSNYPGISIPERVKDQEEEIKSLKNKLNLLNRELESDPKFLLRQIDSSLDALERGEQEYIRGSYSDWFRLAITDLQTMGISKSRLRRRINRLVNLAAKEKYLSSSVKVEVERQGIGRYREYALTNLK